MTDLPSDARVVIVGGGIVGCSIAYHLALRGVTDVVLLERRQLTCGTTWHAAGLVGQLRATHNLTRLAQYTTDLFATLEAETGQATGFRARGSVSVAPSPERFEELKRGASMARVFGLEVNIIDRDRIAELVPFARVDDLVGGVHLPNDGITNPIDTTQALAKGARARGVRIVENVKVTRIITEAGRAVGVQYEADGQQGQIRADAMLAALPHDSDGKASCAAGSSSQPQTRLRASDTATTLSVARHQPLPSDIVHRLANARPARDAVRM